LTKKEITHIKKVMQVMPHLPPVTSFKKTLSMESSFKNNLKTATTPAPSEEDSTTLNKSTIYTPSNNPPKVRI
jgi:hypothetical protein